MPETLTKEQLGRHLARQQGFAQPFADTLTCLRSTAGLYATAPGVNIALLARVRSFNPASLEDAIEHDKSVVRVQAMRGLLYAFPRDLVAAAFVATRSQVEGWARKLPTYDLRPEDMATYRDTVSSATLGGPATIMEIGRAMEGRLSDQGLQTLVTLLCAEGFLVRAYTKGGWRANLHAYQRFKDWLPGLDIQGITREEAQKRLAAAYFRAFGPATLDDFRRWSGFSDAEVDSAVGALELDTIAVEGLRDDYRYPTARAKDLKQPALPPRLVLLPPNDVYPTAYADRRRFLPEGKSVYVFDRAGNSTSVVVADGQIVGLWDFDASRRKLIVRTHLWTEVRDFDRLLTPSVDRLADLLAVQEVQMEKAPLPPPLNERPPGTYASPLKGVREEKPVKTGAPKTPPS
ncbi:MAG TPA: crosslink repair DNA glycosylase YcaQ family protein [Candidatus Thermoplasmatota archaeon]|nr:crosslink repair DNA glycosylase YcaQ family protein [Candidatus Thermoplasmatota archaeon]